MNPDRIQPISRRDPAAVEAVPRLRLLTPAERDEARRLREKLRRARAAKDRST